MDSQQSDISGDATPRNDLPPTGGAVEALASPAAGGGSVSVPSNTDTQSCKPIERILRWGVDSLYLSFSGKISEETEEKLRELKGKAQSADPSVKAEAQWLTDRHAFEVKDKGAGVYAFVLEDACFRISFSTRSANKLPMATVKFSSRYLNTVTPREGMEEVRAILDKMGQLDSEPGVSRLDLFVDFISREDVDAWTREAWVTRASMANKYWEHLKCSGWSIGNGGPIMMRLYDKDLQIEKVGAQYIRELWAKAGWVEGEPVWRLEFEFKRELFSRLGLNGYEVVMGQLNGLWSYAMVDWLRLCIPDAEDATRSRWPVHPLWAALSSLDFGTEEMPKLKRVVADKKPNERATLRRVVSALTTFMATRGLTDRQEALRTMGEGLDTLLETDAFFEGIPADQIIREKVALKTREYCIHNGPINTDDADAEKLKDKATDYRKASRGG